MKIGDKVKVIDECGSEPGALGFLDREGVIEAIDEGGYPFLVQFPGGERYNFMYEELELLNESKEIGSSREDFYVICENQEEFTAVCDWAKQNGYVFHEHCGIGIGRFHTDWRCINFCHDGRYEATKGLNLHTFSVDNNSQGISYNRTVEDLLQTKQIKKENMEIGDKVRVSKIYVSDIPVGSTGRIVEYKDHGVYVNFDKSYKPATYSFNGYANVYWFPSSYLILDVEDSLRSGDDYSGLVSLVKEKATKSPITSSKTSTSVVFNKADTTISRIKRRSKNVGYTSHRIKV